MSTYSGFTHVEVEEAAACPFCLAGRGEPCRDTRTGWLTWDPHPSRLRDAGPSLTGNQDHEGWEHDWSIVHE